MSRWKDQPGLAVFFLDDFDQNGPLDCTSHFLRFCQLLAILPKGPKGPNGSSPDRTETSDHLIYHHEDPIVKTALLQRVYHQQPEVNYLPRFSPQLISLERYTLSVYRAGEIDLFENLDIVHIRLLVVLQRVLAPRNGDSPPS